MCLTDHRSDHSRRLWCDPGDRDAGLFFVLESLFLPKKSVPSQPIEAGWALGRRLQRTDTGQRLPFLLSFVLPSPVICLLCEETTAVP